MSCLAARAPEGAVPSTSGRENRILNGQVANGVDAMHSVVQAIKPNIYDWDFNIFELEERTQGRPLYAVTIALLETEGLLDGWKLKRSTVDAYLCALERLYKCNPYHNNIHAADVTQTAAVIMRDLDAQLPLGLTPLEKFSIIIASAAHDLSHPGVNNDFLVKTRDHQALIYNDRSVNENMHVSKAFLLAADASELDIFAGLSREEYTQCRAWIVSMVLSTDMAFHFELLDKWRAAVTNQPDLSAWKDRGLVFQMLVHLADLANPSRPFPFALKWAERVVTEFMQQGDREASLGLPVTPFCNRELVCMPRAQLNFISLFMRPTLECFESVTPAFVKLARPCLLDTQSKWERLEEAGVLHPAASYPPIPDAVDAPAQ